MVSGTTSATTSGASSGADGSDRSINGSGGSVNVTALAQATNVSDSSGTTRSNGVAGLTSAPTSPVTGSLGSVLSSGGALGISSATSSAVVSAGQITGSSSASTTSSTAIIVGLNPSASLNKGTDGTEQNPASRTGINDRLRPVSGSLPAALPAPTTSVLVNGTLSPVFPPVTAPAASATSFSQTFGQALGQGTISVPAAETTGQGTALGQTSSGGIIVPSPTTSSADGILPIGGAAGTAATTAVTTTLAAGAASSSFSAIEASLSSQMAANPTSSAAFSSALASASASLFPQTSALPLGGQLTSAQVTAASASTTDVDGVVRPVSVSATSSATPTSAFNLLVTVGTSAEPTSVVKQTDAPEAITSGTAGFSVVPTTTAPHTILPTAIIYGQTALSIATSLTTFDGTLATSVIKLTGTTDTGIQRATLSPQLPGAIAFQAPSDNAGQGDENVFIAFDQSLNYDFVAHSSNSLASSQIFTYLPQVMMLGMKYDYLPKMVALLPLQLVDDMQQEVWITTVAQVLIKTSGSNGLSQLQGAINNRGSALYNLNNATLDTLSSMIRSPWNISLNPLDLKPVAPSSGAANVDAFSQSQGDPFSAPANAKIVPSGGTAGAAAGAGAAVWAVCSVVIARRYKKKRQERRAARHSRVESAYGVGSAMSQRRRTLRPDFAQLFFDGHEASSYRDNSDEFASRAPSARHSGSARSGRIGPQFIGPPVLEHATTFPLGAAHM